MGLTRSKDAVSMDAVTLIYVVADETILSSIRQVKIHMLSTMLSPTRPTLVSKNLYWQRKSVIVTIK